MEEKENKTKETNFKTVSTNITSDFDNQNKSNHEYGRTIFIPFISGMVGCAIVVGACFGVPSIKNKLIGDLSINSSTNTTQSNGSVSQIKLSNYSDTAIYAANKILPSIVGIKIQYDVNTTSFFGLSYNKSTATATGSGIIISKDGYILTNNHVVSSSSESNSFYQISEAKKITVTLYNDSKEYEAKIVGRDEQTDLAVIKIDKSGLTAAEFADSDSVKVGEFAMAVGNPVSMNSSVTSGIVSAVNRQITDSDGKKFTCIQTDAAINGGNSGGALVNSEGKVIGVNTLKLAGTGIEGLGFAIPINSTKDITDQLIKYSKVKRPYIGITQTYLDDETAKKYNLVSGAYIRNISEFSPAEKAGLEAGDVIIEADGTKITDKEKLDEIKNKHKIGDEIKLKINREGEVKDITVKLGEQP